MVGRDGRRPGCDMVTVRPRSRDWFLARAILAITQALSAGRVRGDRGDLVELAN